MTNWLLRTFSAHPTQKDHYLRTIGKHDAFTTSADQLSTASKPHATWLSIATALNASFSINDTQIIDYTGSTSASTTGFEHRPEETVRHRFHPPKRLPPQMLEVVDIRAWTWEQRGALLVTSPIKLCVNSAPIPDLPTVPKHLLAASSPVANRKLLTQPSMHTLSINTHSTRMLSSTAIRHSVAVSPRSGKRA
ncbi:hypothetical protein BU23DRAFT_570396 [Bimuria novae-zelandiae CBS 107.79]|uniref:Uncharacterized protein n=1 Tax=Bimuria novae-zelandiae CBS 107.79 TaxID=1447943 RepID=A0A6A5V111_9PLEO|nr:hypothetical protein BU23DRAFT_570396 [Bimuria novae-zelandiae CBS 107.79]